VSRLSSTFTRRGCLTGNHEFYPELVDGTMNSTPPWAE
jgi:hypothetical protein